MVKSEERARTRRAERQSASLVSVMACPVSGVKHWGMMRFDALVIVWGLRSMRAEAVWWARVDRSINDLSIMMVCLSGGLLSI